jgi:hypothetical protein
VDLRTQYSYQMMDPYFVGLIFSVYNSDPLTMVETRDIIAFQAVADTEVRICNQCPGSIIGDILILIRIRNTASYTALACLSVNLNALNERRALSTNTIHYSCCS